MGSTRIALRYYRDSVIFTLTAVHYVTYSHGTDCHAESPSRRVQRFKMVKIDPVSPFSHSLFGKRNFAMGKPTRSTKNEPLGCKYLLLCFSKCLHNYRRPAMKIPELRWCLTEIPFNNPSQFPGTS